MSKKSYDQGYVEGASSSIAKTIDEIGAILEGEFLQKAGEKREALRASIESALTGLAKTWYKKGFNRGHKESFRNFKESKEFPTEISTSVSRSLLPNSKHKIKLKSSLKTEFIEEIEDGLW